MAKCRIITPLEEEVPVARIISETGNNHQLLNLTNVLKDMLIYNDNERATNVGPDPVDPGKPTLHHVGHTGEHQLGGGDLVHLGHGVTQLQEIELNGFAFFSPFYSSTRSETWQTPPGWRPRC